MWATGPDRQIVVKWESDEDVEATLTRPLFDAVVAEINQGRARRVAVLAIHRPCHEDGTDCAVGHWRADVSEPLDPAVCVSCTYDDRLVRWPCPTATAAGLTP